MLEFQSSLRLYQWFWFRRIHEEEAERFWIVNGIVNIRTSNIRTKRQMLEMAETPTIYNLDFLKKTGSAYNCFVNFPVPHFCYRKNKCWHWIIHFAIQRTVDFQFPVALFRLLSCQLPIS